MRPTLLTPANERSSRQANGELVGETGSDEGEGRQWRTRLDENGHWKIIGLAANRNA